MKRYRTKARIGDGHVIAYLGVSFKAASDAFDEAIWADDRAVECWSAEKGWDTVVSIRGGK